MILEVMRSRAGLPLRWKRWTLGCELQEGRELTALLRILALALRRWPGHRHSLHFKKVSERMNKWPSC